MISKKIFEGMSRAMKVQILQESLKTGKPIKEVAARYSLPDMAILDFDGRFNYDGQRITPEEWYKVNPVGEYGRIVIIIRRNNAKETYPSTS